MASWFETRGVAALLTMRVFLPPSSREAVGRGRGWGVSLREPLFSVNAAPPPTPDPSPPRAMRVEGGEFMTSS
jgi:hypothetical protein